MLSLTPLVTVTPLHVWCMLVQFVHCQPDDNPGGVIISEFSGAAQRFGVEHRINPYNIADVITTCTQWGRAGIMLEGCQKCIISLNVGLSCLWLFIYILFLSPQQRL